MSEWLQRLWYAPRLSTSGYVLVPLSWAFAAAVWLRRRAYRIGLLRTRRVPAPVIVIGNITVGGAGKTPLTAWVVDLLRRAGLRPGIVSRGYGRASGTVREVTAESAAEQVGDEPLLLATRLCCPVVVGADRVAAAHQLLAGGEVDAVVCDDGLQHYRLERDVEIAVVDGERGLGNGRLLPAGPLREPRSRLGSVGATVYNGGKREGQRMRLVAGQPRALRKDGTARSWNTFTGQPVHAVAGIAHPERFFRMLRSLGLRVIAHPFPDHHRFRAQDIRFADELDVMMTEKDAVKCRAFADKRHWYVPVEACLEVPAHQALCRALSEALAPRFPQAARQLQSLGFEATERCAT